MSDLPIPGLVLSPDALKMKIEIERSEAILRVQKLHLSKLELENQVKKVDYEIQIYSDKLKEYDKSKEVKNV
jgi:hypothetical protein